MVRHKGKKVDSHGDPITSTNPAPIDEATGTALTSADINDDVVEEPELTEAQKARAYDVMMRGKKSRANVTMRAMQIATRGVETIMRDIKDATGKDVKAMTLRVLPDGSVDVARFYLRERVAVEASDEVREIRVKNLAIARLMRNGMSKEEATAAYTALNATEDTDATAE